MSPFFLWVICKCTNSVLSTNDAIHTPPPLLEFDMAMPGKLHINKSVDIVQKDRIILSIVVTANEMMLFDHKGKLDATLSAITPDATYHLSVEYIYPCLLLSVQRSIKWRQCSSKSFTLDSVRLSNIHDIQTLYLNPV